jgi:hypothetical protein
MTKKETQAANGELFAGKAKNSCLEIFSAEAMLAG